MHPIQPFLASLPFSDELKGRLFTFSGSPHQQFYLSLPALLVPAFPDVSPAQLQQLLLSSYLYSRFTLFLDDVLDGDFVPTAAGQGELLLAYVHLHEHAIRGLGSLFPPAHPFWSHFAQTQQAFARAQQAERSAAGRAAPWTRPEYEQLAIGKAAVAEGLVHALAGLSSDDRHHAAVLTCLRQYHLALQYEDDIKDFSRDLEEGQRTLAHDEVRQFLTDQGLDLPAAPAHRQAFLFTSGVAEEHLGRAAKLYREIADVAARLGLLELTRVVTAHAAQALESSALIRQQVQAATARAATALSPTAC